MKKLLVALTLSLVSLSSFADSYICYALEGSRHVPLFTLLIENENENSLRPVTIYEAGRRGKIEVAATGVASLNGITLTLLDKNLEEAGVLKAKPWKMENVLQGSIQLDGLAGGVKRPIGCQKAN